MTINTKYDKSIAPPIPDAPLTQTDLENLQKICSEYYHTLLTTTQIPIGIRPDRSIIWGIKHDN